MDIRFADNIRSFRKERRLTREQFAEMLGVTTGAAYKWESVVALRIGCPHDTPVDHEPPGFFPRYTPKGNGLISPWESAM